MSWPYCAKCGWNRDAAARQLERMSWLLPALMVVFDATGIIGIGFVMKNWPGAILFATLPTLVLGFVYASARQGLAKMRAPAVEVWASESAGELNSAASVAAGTQDSSAQKRAEQYHFLVSLPPPRPVRLGGRGQVLMMGSLLLAFGLEALLISNLYGTWELTRSFADFHGQEIFLTCLAVAVASVPFFVRGGMARDQDLVENGAVTIARVTGQRTFKMNSTITYEFKDATEKTVSRSANDFTRSFYEGMTVPVFYDPQNPKRHVAACSSFFEVTNPSKD
ncbi:MAG TPA: hypothetical protein VND42_04050 [Candidatus Acidoferrales bacterium]|nr:hypothetical protein [Candidatus Acidoferrales bacterium]